MSDTFYHGPETPWKRDTPGYTEYHVSAERSDDPYAAPGAYVKVSKPYTRYNYVQSGSTRYRHTEDIDLMREEYGDGPHDQRALFNIAHRRPYVSMMNASRQFGHHIPTLLGIAAQETQARYGEPLRSDTNLSERASGMVQRLAEAGVVKAPEYESRNHITPDEYADDWPDTRTAVRYVGGKPVDIPRADVAMGRHMVREALRRPRQAVGQTVATISEAAKGKQEKLFGE